MHAVALGRKIQIYICRAFMVAIVLVCQLQHLGNSARTVRVPSDLIVRDVWIISCIVGSELVEIQCKRTMG